MPKKPRGRGVKRKRQGLGLTNEQLQHLFYGRVWLDDVFPFASEADRRECWFRHKDDILAMMHDDYENQSIFNPRLLYGERPDCWFQYENVPERKVTVTKFQPGNIKYPGGLELENREVQSTPDFLDEHGLWLTDEKRRYLAMVEGREARENKLRRITDLDERREMLGTVKAVERDYED